MILMGSSTKKAFAARLVKAMLAAGHRSMRGAKAGVAVAELAAAAEITREMARRYVLGEAIPDTDRLDKIAGWLGVKVAWLRDGDADQGPRVEQPSTAYLPEEALEIARVWMLLPPEIQDRYRSMLFTDAVMHSVLPWLRQHKPRGERYDDFERSVQQDFEKLGAQLPLNI
jgi:transcriptional regulator with XRE-family HTH domain